MIVYRTYHQTWRCAVSRVRSAVAGTGRAVARASRCAAAGAAAEAEAGEDGEAGQLEEAEQQQQPDDHGGDQVDGHAVVALVLE